MCNTDGSLQIAYWSMHEKHQNKSIFYHLLRTIATVCCNQNVTLHLARFGLNPRDLEENFDERKEDMLFPVTRSVLRQDVTLPPPYYHFISVIESPGTPSAFSGITALGHIRGIKGIAMVHITDMPLS